ncbi:MAG: hypothetical protein ACLQU2_35970, partial [Candidatus Binataceae bacterium]
HPWGLSCPLESLRRALQKTHQRPLFFDHFFRSARIFFASRLSNQLGADGGPVDPVISALISGPLRFIRAYTDRQTACYLQTVWTSDVLWPLNKATTPA